MSPQTVTPQQVLDFWFAPGREEQWFAPSPALDEEIRARFAQVYESARSGKLQAWKKTPEGLLALILVLDQFPRNMFRDNPQAFATDRMAIDLSRHGLEHEQELHLPPIWRIFFYMPLMHSEMLTEQELSVAMYERLGFPANLEFARQHHYIIKHFGRFPHRNHILGRASTPEEEEFLTQPGSSF
ncbi:DUF924 family protein [bacterium]|nr:DUF924 family protein [bacterium]